MMRLAFAQPLSVEIREGKLPERIKVLGWGDNANVNGKKVVVGETLAKNVQLPLYAWKQVALDFEHNTVPGTPAYAETREPREVAGYGMVDIVPGDGVYLVMHSWTPKGLETAHNYACVSATPFITEGAFTAGGGNVQSVVSVALCRNGAVPGMAFVDVPLSAVIPLNVEPHVETKVMDWKKVIIDALGLDAGATDEEIAAALKERVAVKKEEPLAADAASVAAQVAEAVKAAVAPLSAQVAALAAKDGMRDKSAAVSAARMEGKAVTLSAAVLGKMTPDELAEHIKALPVTVPLTARTPEGVVEVPLSAGPTDAQRTIAMNCGADPSKVWPSKQETK